MKKSMTNFRFIGVFILVFLFIASQSLAFAAEKSRKKDGFLGVTVEELSRSMKKQLNADFGVVIAHISVDSPADEYGLTEDDVIQYVGDVKMRRPSTLTRTIKKIKPDTEVKIQVVRDGAKKTINVKIGTRRDMNDIIVTGKSGDNVFSFYRHGSGYLGVQLFELNDELAPYFNVKADEGVLILNVEEDSPAEKADLKSGDVIVKVDDEEVSNPADVQDIISEFEEDEEVELEVVRNKKTMKVKVKLEERENLRNFFISPNRNTNHIEIGPYRDALHNFQKEFKLDLRKNAPNIKIEKGKTKSLNQAI